MKLQQLRYLVAIADNQLNVSKAARSLYTSQPGVSKQIIELERELGTPLFERRGKSLHRITSLGNLVITRARLIMHEIESIQAMARRQRDDEAGAYCPSSRGFSRGERA